MSTARAAAILLAKELRLEFRSRELLSTTVVLALVIVVQVATAVLGWRFWRQFA